MANITGGGIPENLPRCLPKRLTPIIDWNSWEIPDIFKKILMFVKQEMTLWVLMKIGWMICEN